MSKEINVEAWCRQYGSNIRLSVQKKGQEYRVVGRCTHATPWQVTFYQFAQERTALDFIALLKAKIDRQ